MNSLTTQSHPGSKTTKMLAQPLPPGVARAAIPWQDRPAGIDDVVWRYDANPIIARNAIPTSNSIFNSAVVPFNGSYAGVFRCDDKRRVMDIHRGFSADGYRWDIDPERISFKGNDPEVTRFEYRYDPRVCWLDDRYYISWCNGYHGPTALKPR